MTDKVESLFGSVADERSGEDGYPFRCGDMALVAVHKVGDRHDDRLGVTA